MGVRLETVAGIPDGIKWLFVVVILCGALFAFYYYADESLLLRVIGLLAATGAAAAVALQTEKGRIAWEYIREARTEVRKVVWPTRKETTQTTLVVIALVGLVAVILWMLDSFLAWVVRTLLGVGG